MYCIYNTKKELYCRYNEYTIIFNTKKECQEFMKKIPAFFDNETEYIEIKPFTEEMIDKYECINYLDLNNFDFSKENNMIKNKNMKERLKNG